MECKEKLEKYFKNNRVEFRSMTHPTAYTAQDVAAAQKVKGKQLAKVTIINADAKNIMLVLPASHRVDFTKLKRALGAKEARLAEEKEFSDLFPDCDTGAMPPFGNLYNVPVYVDQSLALDPEIVFQAGSHRETMKITYHDYAQLAHPIIADFAVHL